MARIEYRVCWSASTNVQFHGYGDWEEWDAPGVDATEQEVVDYLLSGEQRCEGLSLALEWSGFEWWVETRTVD